MHHAVIYGRKSKTQSCIVKTVRFLRRQQQAAGEVTDVAEIVCTTVYIGNVLTLRIPLIFRWKQFIAAFLCIRTDHTDDVYFYCCIEAIKTKPSLYQLAYCRYEFNCKLAKYCRLQPAIRLFVQKLKLNQQKIFLLIRTQVLLPISSFKLKD